MRHFRAGLRPIQPAPPLASLGDMATLSFVPLAPAIAEQIADWFDDADTVRYLGGQQWLQSALRFERPVAPDLGEPSSVHSWLVLASDQPVAVVGVAIFPPHTGILELAVAPTRRRRGIGKRVLASLWDLAELAEVEEIYGEVEPGHRSAIRLAEAAGFEPDATAMSGRLRLRGRRPAAV